MTLWQTLDAERPVLIAGPTASGKSALALEIAARSGGVIVNADALQVFDNWRILTARPSAEEEARAPHRLYGHIAGDADYSVGHWLREVAPILAASARPIIVGGTGLYFSALTEGLAEIPATPPEIRAEADLLPLELMRDALDPASAARLDLQNRARVQRAWEVLRATGRGIAAWQDDTPPPLLPLANAQPLVMRVDREWLNARIARRFDMMLEHGALEEARANFATWSPTAQSARAIGASELIGHLKGELTLDEARTRAVIASRQYAKRQRSWFRARMGAWQAVELP
ncbi:tRNA (adenosine(37)-N6)-dimethylallyltransferase MiaA [Pacificitalea manganoxidans]|uniref:tRNA dimethylallyltransferase n=1 Tax=Pacificitalea manganoxidans TaxID=1411902 RepID=A0A291M378_9RHOB|nr:tRNA (adenosine(37)-N6)-dimethylallyltransferase MiaA [Pacificitalea manganoxidans]ATI43360.1 tRNA (adenosine(37)-N6)-dimethylallyltransferase MiaA [Pacificitalea manganoxidans]MDR6309353.1 tRNA dimethylallyltransferase [Pacificitalea manganoxidans]